MGAALAAGATWLAVSLDFARGWLIPSVLGLALGALVPLFLLRGSSVRITADGQLHYTTGTQPHLSVALADLGPPIPVRSGMLVGIGFPLDDPARVTFLDRRGISYASMRRYRAHLGCDLVLEFLTPADARVIRELQAELASEHAELGS